MPDLFDQASDTESLHRDMTIAEIRNRKPNKYTGYCLCCNEAISEGRFCCAECHEDWEITEKFKKITGSK